MNSFFFLSPRILQRAIWHVTRALLFLFCSFEVRGLENIQNDINRVIFAANHSSEMDAIIVPAALPFSSPLLPIFYVSRPRGFYKTSGWRQILYGGFFFKLWGAHAAVAGSHDYEKSLSAHLAIMERGGSVLIFPEGRKTRDGSIGHEAHGGVAFLACASGTPVVPVRIAGVFGFSLADFLLRRRRISVSFGAPVFFTPDGYADYKKDAYQILAAIASLYPHPPVGGRLTPKTGGV